jgi:plasmid stability protein
MATLTIKGLPKELHERLKFSAGQHHRSINKEAITLLGESLERTPAEGEALLKRAMDIRASLTGFRTGETALNKAKSSGRR